MSMIACAVYVLAHIRSSLIRLLEHVLRNRTLLDGAATLISFGTIQSFQQRHYLTCPLAHFYGHGLCLYDVPTLRLLRGTLFQRPLPSSSDGLVEASLILDQPKTRGVHSVHVQTSLALMRILRLGMSPPQHLSWYSSTQGIAGHPSWYHLSGWLEMKGDRERHCCGETPLHSRVTICFYHLQVDAPLH
jgi:hypothetical protein